jgi:hypothetical protein
VTLSVGVVGAVALLMSPATALAGPWGNASGSNSAFAWSGGASNTNLFGDPTINQHGFFFNDTDNFRAEGGDGVSDSASDFARVTLNTSTVGAPAIHEITVFEWGSWSHDISEIGDFTFQADYSILRYLPSPFAASGSLSMTWDFQPDGTWTCARKLTAGEAGNPPASDQDWIYFQITVTNTIQVNGTAPADSWIQKEGMRIVVPEPASGMLLLMGLGAAALRRSRR